MSTESDIKKWYHKGWPTLFLGFFFGLMFAAMIVGISGAQLWGSFKARYLKSAA